MLPAKARFSKVPITFKAESSVTLQCLHLRFKVCRLKGKALKQVVLVYGLKPTPLDSDFKIWFRAQKT